MTETVWLGPPEDFRVQYRENGPEDTGTIVDTRAREDGSEYLVVWDSAWDESTDMVDWYTADQLVWI